MKKIAFVAALVGALVFASCGMSKEEEYFKQADDMFAQAETTVSGIDNMDDFLSFLNEFTEMKDAFTQELFVAYQVDDSTTEVPEEMRVKIYDRATAYNKVEADKFAELVTPYLDRLESSLVALAEAGKNATQEQKDEYEAAFEAIQPFIGYDNVRPDIQERFEEIVAKMEALELL